MYEANLV